MPTGSASTSHDRLLAPSFTRCLIERFLRQPVLAALGSKPLHHLTTREREVLELIAHGLSNSEIVARLDLTEATIKLTWPTAIATSASATMP